VESLGAKKDSRLFSETVNSILGPDVVVVTGKITSLHLRKVPAKCAEKLRAAKCTVEHCSSRARKLDNACIGIQNIACLLDFAAIPKEHKQVNCSDRTQTRIGPAPPNPRVAEAESRHAQPADAAEANNQEAIVSGENRTWAKCCNARDMLRIRSIEKCSSVSEKSGQCLRWCLLDCAPKLHNMWTLVLMFKNAHIGLLICACSWRNRR
jgi:hypothetical protein